MSFTTEKDWVTAAGLRAVVIMVDMGHRCGYVGLPAEHPLHGVGYSERSPYVQMNPARTTDTISPILLLCAVGKSMEELNTPEYVFEVHGGLTYANGKSNYPAPSDGLWWFGYDCGHAGDAAAPDSSMGAFPHEGDVHRTLEYCVSECESLAKQLAEVTA